MQKDRARRITKKLQGENKTSRNSAGPLSKDISEVMKMSWRVNLYWRRWSLSNNSDWPWRQKKKDEQYRGMMQLPNGSGWPLIRTKKVRLAKMVATTQLRLVLETEERRAKAIGI